MFGLGHRICFVDSDSLNLDTFSFSDSFTKEKTNYVIQLKNYYKKITFSKLPRKALEKKGTIF